MRARLWYPPLLGGAVALFLAAAIFAWLLAPVAEPEPWQDEATRAPWHAWLQRPRQAPSAKYLRRWLPIVDPDGQLHETLELTEREFVVRIGDKEKRYPFSSEPERRSRPRRSLEGLRIVIDPGHRGGAWSRQEQRHFFRSPNRPVREGDLTHAVAEILIPLLRASGATVWRTRGAPPTEHFPIGTEETYDPNVTQRTWLAEQRYVWPDRLWFELWPARIAWWRLQARGAEHATRFPFRLYNGFDLARRAKLAEAKDADLQLSIHFNMAKDPKINRLVVFVYGHALPDELDSRSEQFFAARALLSGQQTRATQVATTISRSLHRALDIKQQPYRPPKNGRLKKAPLVPEWGVFARNLGVLRRGQSIALLVEGPCMNAYGEYAQLLTQDVFTPEGPVSSRVVMTAHALHEAISQSAPALWASRDDRIHRGL